MSVRGVGFLMAAVCFLLIGGGRAEADPLLTGIPELDALIQNMHRRQGSEDMEIIEIGNTRDRADTYESKTGRLADNLHSNNRDEMAWFTPPILRMLLMAGETPVSYHWCEQLDTSVPAADDQVHTSLRWAIERELQKHLPTPADYRQERLVEIEEHVRKLHVTNAKKQRDWKMEHH